MAITDVLEPEKLGVIEQQLQVFIGALGEPVFQRRGIGESFQVWTVSLQDFRDSGVQNAHWNQVWHHQLRPAGGRSDAFARSFEDVEPEVRAAYRSELAREIDLAIDAIDRNPDLQSSSLVTRLLEVLEAHLTTLWITGGVQKFIPLDRYASRGDRRFQPIDHEELLARLPTKPAIGISEGPPRDRRADF